MKRLLGGTSYNFDIVRVLQAQIGFEVADTKVVLGDKAVNALLLIF